MSVTGMDLKSLLLFSVTVIGFGLAFSLTNIAVTSIPPLWVAAGRSLIALLGLGTFLLMRARPIMFERAHIPAYFWVGLLTGVVPYVSISWGQQLIPSSLAGVLFASTPLLTLIFGFVLFKAPRPRIMALLGAAVGLGGVGLALSGSVETSPQVVRGAAATLCAAASYAIGGLVLQRERVTDMTGFSTVQLIPVTAILVTIAWMASGLPSGGFTSQSMLALVALGLVGTCIPLLCLFNLVKFRGASSASLTTFFIPFTAVIIGVGFLDETFSAIALFGLLTALLGSFLVFCNQTKG